MISALDTDPDLDFLPFADSGFGSRKKWNMNTSSNVQSPCSGGGAAVALNAGLEAI